MASFTIAVSKEEKIAVIQAIEELNKLQHVRYMSRSMIANASRLKETKVRAILQDLIANGLIIAYVIDEKAKRKRYYFGITNLAKTLVTE